MNKNVWKRKLLKNKYFYLLIKKEKNTTIYYNVHIVLLTVGLQGGPTNQNKMSNKGTFKNAY